MNNKHTAIIKGRKERTMYRFGVRKYHIGFPPEVLKISEFTGHYLLWECELDAPVLEVGEILYIDDLNIEVTVQRRVRTTTGEYIYETDFVELFSDELTSISLKEAEKKQRNYLEAMKKREDKLAADRAYKEELKKKNRTWFEKWLGE